MSIGDSKELLLSVSQSDDAEKNVNNKVDDTKEKISTANEYGEGDKVEDINGSTSTTTPVPEIAVDISASEASGHEKGDGLGEKDTENGKDAVKNNSGKETKKIVRKRKKNVEETPSPINMKKKSNDLSAAKKKESQLCDKSMEGDEEKEIEGVKQESIEKGYITDDDEKGKTNDADALKGTLSPSAKKQSKKADGMGLIFMCNAKTKKDCFKYNVFGLPEGKKEQVAKIYKGMRLFLFDFDLKLLYGVYKAASPGGYNIEPKAFDSKFPAQVRFSLLNDCLPVPEEIFKEAIQQNYFSKNKFDCQLSPEQVKKLCKLFQKPSDAVRRNNGPPSSRKRELKRRSPPSRVRHRSPYRRARYPSPPPYRVLPPPQSVARALPPPQPLYYTYEQPGDDYYRRDTPTGYQPSYIQYMEPALYHEPVYQQSLPPAYAARLRETRSPPRYHY